MIVVESGGTKSTWVFNSVIGEPQSFQTVGLHPQELTNEKRVTVLNLIKEYSLEGEQVNFFGAGCESEEAKKKISVFLNGLGLDVNQVQTDVYAACLAHLGNQKGVVGIIGTGAVGALFDGEKIIKQTSGLGYLIGDEGSGYDIGKRLLQHYFRNELPLEIKSTIELHFNHKSILHRIHEPDGRFFIAGLTKIVHQYAKEDSIKEILRHAFESFCETALKPLSSNYPIHFIGSVAYYFEENLKEALHLKGFKIGEVKTEAVFSVFDFLSSEVQN